MSGSVDKETWRLALHVPRRQELTERPAWLLDPDMMSYNAGWKIPHPGYDNETGCIAWPVTEGDSFLASFSDPSQSGYFYLLDRALQQFVGQVHYRVTSEE